MNFFLMITFGLATGVMSGLLGVGGGVLMVPVFVYVFKMNIEKAIGTSLFVIMFIALVGSVKQFLNGNIEVKNLTLFIVAALVGGWLGATLSGTLPFPVLRKLFAIFLLIISCVMFFKG